MTHHDLNFNQQQAVDSNARCLLIAAGPGSGKTHTLTCRIAVRAAALAPGTRILAVTFTNKAADEMRERLRARVVDCDQRVLAVTFHQFCLRVLREYGHEHFSVSSEDQCLDAAAEIWPQMTLPQRRCCLENISRAKSVDFLSAPDDTARAFDEALRQRGLYDFDDLLLQTYWLLKDNAVVRQELQDLYPEIFVDEYQDLNPVQHALLKLMAGEKGRVTVIGDPDQAIYGFRGSRVELFHQFVRDFDGAQTIRLTENYRNAADILTASCQVMKKDGGGSGLEQIAKIHAEGRLIIHESPTDKAEAESIVHTIEQLVGGTSLFSRDSGRVSHQDEAGMSFGSIAVLYRLKSQARELKTALERSGMPFLVSGGAGDAGDIEEDLFSQRMAVQDVDAEKISLMTLHAAKGLEFSCVFICGCEDGLLPLNLLKMAADLEEERRLFYVGMTRAKQFLYLTRATKRMLYGRRLSLPPSPFLADIEESLKQYARSEFKKKPQKPDDGQMVLFH